MAAGRPSKYEQHVKPKLSAIRTLVRGGHTQKEIAEFLEIDEDTIKNYKDKHAEFFGCFKKEDIIDEVENTFINRLTGKYKATKEVYERKLNELTKEHEMVLSKIEKYEIPFNDGAYLNYLSRVRPEKWGFAKEDTALDTVVSALKEAVNKNKEEANDTN